MSQMPLTAELFARLMSLPPEHPERLAWSGRPEFESMRSLYEQFEGAARPSNVSERDLREVEVALERRFRDALPSESGVEPVASRPAVRPVRASRPWWVAFPRPALAMAAVIVAVAGIWFASRPRSTALRGAEDTPVIAEPRQVADGLEIRWTPVAGAESYRLSFVDDSMREIAAVEAWPGTTYSLKTSALPPGLEHGADVVLQVQPVRASATAGSVGTRSLRVP